MIAAAGAIYVIGGSNFGTWYSDVWASTDGGARPDSVGGWSGGRLGGYSGVLTGTKGVLGVLQGVLRGYKTGY